MPGSPIRRARREAEKREAELRQSDPERWAAEQMLRQQQQQAEQQQSTLAPLSSTADRVRVGATHELYRTVLDGAQDALTLLREGMAGTARGRDLRDLRPDPYFTRNAQTDRSVGCVATLSHRILFGTYIPSVSIDRLGHPIG